MATPTNDFYTCASGVSIHAGRTKSSVSLLFADGVPEVRSIASDFPDIGGSAVVLSISSGSLPASMTLDPLGKTIAYDGTPGAATAAVVIQSEPTAPSLTFSNATGVVPVMAGVVFREGDVTGPLGASHSGLSVAVLCTWPDGSVKHAAVCGRVDASARVTFTTVFDGSPVLTGSAIQAAAPSAVVDLGAHGSVSLSSLLASPTKTWVSTPKMVECHYRAQIGSTDMAVLFYVRLWDDGTMWIRAAVENSNRIRASGTNYVISGTVTIDGSVVQTYSAWTLYRNTQNIFERWVGATQYDVVVNHDVKQITRTKLVPNYGMATTISDSALNSLPTTYTPNGNLLFTAGMGNTGYQPQIGILPKWDAMYLVSGDSRAWRSVMAHGKAGFSYGILWREGSTMLCPTDHPNDNYGGTGYGGGTEIANGPLTWENAHHPSMGYLAYLLSGDALYADAMLGQCATLFQLMNAGYGAGVARLDKWGQTRGTAWFMRTLGQAAALVRDSSVERPVFAAWLATYIDYYASVSFEDPAAVNSEIGYPTVVSTYNPSNPQTVGTWMHHFWIGTMGFLSDIGALSGAQQTKLVSLRDWMYRGIVGVLGDGSGYCYAYASRYTITISSEVVPDYTLRKASQIYQTWAEVMTATNGAQSCGTAMLGTGAEAPSAADAGYWGNLLPAITYAVDHNAAGAAAAYGRMTGASNWSALAGSGWASTPLWGTTPRPAIQSTSKSVNVEVAGAPDEFFSAESNAGAYNSSTKTWTPGRGSDGRITQVSFSLLPTDGTWVEIAGTAFVASVQPLLTSALPTYNDPGSSDLASVLDAYNGFAHDVPGGRLFAHGGGHQNSANNGIYRFDLMKMTWAIAKLPDMQTYWPANYKSNPPRDNSYTIYTNAKDAVTADPTTTAFYTDEFYDPVQPLASTRNPTARHTYYAMTFHGGKLRHGVRRYWEWDEATGTWTSRYPLGKNATTHTQSGGGYTGEAVKGTWDEVNHRYICTPSFTGAPSSGWAWNEDSQTWSNPTNLLGGWEAYAAVFARRGREWCSFARPTLQGTYWPPQIRVWNLDTGTRTNVALSGLVQSKCPDDTNAGEATIMEYVEANGKFFVATPYDLNDAYANTANLPLEAFWIDTAAGTITHEPQIGKWPALTTTSLVKNKLFYIPQIKCLCIAPDATSNIRLRRFP